MAEEVKYYQVNGKYRIVIERAAIKGIDGFKVEVNSDDFDDAQNQIESLYEYAKGLTIIGGRNEKIN